MKKPKLYVETGTKHAITMVCANKIPCLEPYLPDLKKIQNHLIYERRAASSMKIEDPNPWLSSWKMVSLNLFRERYHGKEVILTCWITLI